jgi:ectoine hydroxylase-related dioxygenase (phytanoyl-CoA dioxygenase family)
MCNLDKPISDFERDITEQGWCLFEGAIGPSQCARLRADCLKWIEICAHYQVENGINSAGDGTAHHTLGGGDSLDAFFHEHLCHVYISHYLAKAAYIVHAFNPVGNEPGRSSHVHNIHRDVQTFIANYNLRLNMLVMLDDFTLDNGATQVMSGSHTRGNRPTNAEFDEAATSIIGPAGSIVLFNSYLWHRGAMNKTECNRVALTASFGPAFIKPQMDYARMLGDEYGQGISELSRQVLGYNSLVPQSLSEWYQPKARRLYRSDQG